MSKWISVKDELPEFGRRVMIYWPHWSRDPVVGVYLSIGLWESESALSSYEEFPPTHWQPLPDPPEEP